MFSTRKRKTLGFRKHRCATVALGYVLCLVVSLGMRRSEEWAWGQEATAQTPSVDKLEHPIGHASDDEMAHRKLQLERELLVPFEDLALILESAPERVFMTRAELAAMQAAAVKVAAPKLPYTARWLSSDYEIEVQEGRAIILATLQIDVLAEGWHAMPLEMYGVGLLRAELDDEPASLGKDDCVWVFVKGVGTHRLRLHLTTTMVTLAAQQTLQVALPQWAAASYRMTVPGNVEIKSGAQVFERRYEEESNRTLFRLQVPSGPVEITMTLNNKILKKDHAVVVRGVVVDEITEAYEKVHGVFSIQPLHGAVDRATFLVPSDFEVEEVTSPFLARWYMEPRPGYRTMVVEMREAIQERSTWNITLIRRSPRSERWSWPRLEAVEVANQVLLLGQMLAENLKMHDVVTRDLLPVDQSVLMSAIPPSMLKVEPGAPRLRPSGLYHAVNSKYAWEGEIHKPTAEVDASIHSRLMVSDRGLKLLGTLDLTPQREKLFTVEFTLPVAWELNQVSLTAPPANGVPIGKEWIDRHVENNLQRFRVRLPTPVGLDSTLSLSFDATFTPTGWFNDWKETEVLYPEIGVLGVTRAQSALAVRGEDDIVIQAKEAEALVPLFDANKGSFRYAEEPSDLLMRASQAAWKLVLKAERPGVMISAHTVAFYAIHPQGSTVHHEIQWDVKRGRTSKLRFTLPESTPTELSLRGLGSAVVKESSQHVENGFRVWDIVLAQPQADTIRIAVDYQLPMKEGEQPLALPRVLDAVFQSGTVSVEGDAELDVVVVPSGSSMRQVDVGELADAEYVVGNRLVGVYELLGERSELTVQVEPRLSEAIPSAIAEGANIMTRISRQGVSQTVAKYHLRTQGLYLELLLPEGASLWSITLNDEPLSPHREGERILIEIAKSGSKLDGGKEKPSVLQVVYEMPVPHAFWRSGADMEPPALRVAHEAGTWKEVPTADLRWEVWLPKGSRLVATGGTLMETQGRGLLDRVHGWLERLHRWGGDLDLQSRFQSVSKSAMMPTAVDRNMQPPPMAAITVDEKALMPQAMDALTEAETALPAIPQQKEARDALEGRTASGANTGGKEAKLFLGRLSLDGVRSLPILMEQESELDSWKFTNLGGSPRLRLAWIDAARSDWIAWLTCIITLTMGVRITVVHRRFFLRFLMLSWVGALVLPECTPWVLELEPVSIGIISGTLMGLAFWAISGALRSSAEPVGGKPGSTASGATGSVSESNTTSSQASGLGVWLGLVIGLGGQGLEIYAAENVVSNAQSVESPQGLVEAKQEPLDERAKAPFKVLDRHTIVVPYDPDKPRPRLEIERILVPYELYSELWNGAHPETRIDQPHPSLRYAVRASEYRARIESDNSLLLKGSMEVETWSEEAIQIPLSLAGGILTKAQLDGAPAQIKSRIQEGSTEAVLWMHVQGKGRKRLELEIRFPVVKSGGWRAVQGKVPVGPATAWKLQVAAFDTELKLAHMADRNERITTEPDQVFELPFGDDGRFELQWRERIRTQEMEQGLTAESMVLVDLHEARLQMTWQVKIESRHGMRKTLQLEVPRGWLVEKVSGNNIRGWNAEATSEDSQSVEVQFLQSVSGHEDLTVTASMASTGSLFDETTHAMRLGRVVGAMLDQGILVFRRSARLQMEVALEPSLPRVEIPQAFSKWMATIEAGPIPLQTYQAYQFGNSKVSATVLAKPIQYKNRVENRVIMRLSADEASMEGMAVLTIQGSPLQRIRMSLPQEWEFEKPEASIPFEWSIERENERTSLDLRLASSVRDRLVFVWRARSKRVVTTTPRPGGLQDIQVSLPAIRFHDMEREEGAFAIQSDPGYDMRPIALTGCTQDFVRSVDGWLSPEQRGLLRGVIRYGSAEYSGRLEVVAKTPIVSGTSFTNVRVTDRSVEETMLLDWTIRESGVHQFSVVLPGWMRDAEVRAPLVRSIRRIPLAGGVDAPVRFLIDLQDDVMGSFRVLLLNDRPRQTGKAPLGLPVLETGQVEQRFVTLENGSRDELVVSDLIGLRLLDRQQSQWKRLASLFGERLSEAYIATGNDNSPGLQFATQERELVATVAARIGMATTQLVLDDAGNYRASQEYRVENRTESFLEVQSPQGSRIWTVEVAGEPVKPLRASTADRWRIPLIRTDEGDLDYGVRIQYGGVLPKPSWYSRTEFPLMKTVNIRVESSQVRLYLPESRQWYGFGGTMGNVQSEQALTASWLNFKTKQVEQLTQLLSNASGRAYSQARAAVNLKQLESSLGSRAGRQPSKDDTTLSKMWEANSLALEKAQSAMQQIQVQNTQLGNTYNREVLNLFCETQQNDQGRNVVQNLNGNFAVNMEGLKVAQDFDVGWLNQHALGTLVEPAVMAGQRIQTLEEQLQGQQKFKQDRLSQGERSKEQKSLPQDEAMGRLPNSVDASRSNVQSLNRGKFGGNADSEQQARRYQQRLEMQSQNAAEGMMLGGGMGGEAVGGGGRFSGNMGPPPAADLPGITAPAQANDVKRASNVATGARSLQVEFPVHGRAYLFATPRGDLELSASSLAMSSLQKWVSLLGMGILVLAMTAAVRFGDYLVRHSRKLGLGLGLLMGLASVFLNQWPMYGGVLLLIVLAAWLAGFNRSTVSASSVLIR